MDPRTFFHLLSLQGKTTEPACEGTGEWEFESLRAGLMRIRRFYDSNRIATSADRVPTRAAPS